MAKIENFNGLVDRAMQMAEHPFMRPVIAKELLHYDILFCLDREGLFDQLTFQGGTALRLCYGSPRFSEDLDFAGGHDFKSSQLMLMKKCLEEYITGRYGLEISVKEPKDMVTFASHENIKVAKWQISITTEPEKKDIPKQKIKLEVTNVPAYARVPQALKRNYELLPDGYGDVLIMVESLEEIMADKLVALVSCQRYVRYRDIWDLHWLNQQGVKFNKKFVLTKIKDYKETDYAKNLDKTIIQLNEIIYSKAFKDEMTRFLPSDALERTLKKEKFLIFLLNEMSSIFLQVKKVLEGPASND